MLPPVIVPTSPLSLAARAGDVAACREALAAGVDADVNSALRVAVSARRTEVVALLLDAGGNPSPQDDWLICIAASTGDEGIVRLLHQHGASVTAQANRPLLEAAMNGCASMCQTLIDMGADPNAVSARALLVAVKLGHADAARVLLQAGADPSHLNSHEKAGGLREMGPAAADVAQLLYPGRNAQWLERSARSKGNEALANELAASVARASASARLSSRPRMR